MNEYKRIIKSQKTRFKILNILRFIPDKLMIRIQYWIKLKRKLHLRHPKRYTEKIQWYKLYYRNPLMIKCVDKYCVRQYIAEKGLKHILNELYFAVDDPGKIDFGSLPNKFALKVTNGSETNIFIKNKNEIDEEDIKNKLAYFLKMGNISAGREWAYKGSSKLIIAEKLLEDDTNTSGGISDYKFLCFNGVPHFIVYDCDRFSGHKRNIYDLDWNNLNIITDCPPIDRFVEKPTNLDEMIRIASILSEDFPAVRVDLYNIQGHIIFGELTFYPWSGYVEFAPDDFDVSLGELFPLIKFRT